MGPPEQGSGGVLAAAVGWVTELLQGDDAWDERLSEAMQRLGEAAAVDRAFVFQNVRDPQGRLHAVGLTCTHLGCRLTWNTAETSWDCGCHGSRFDTDGNILNGPAVKPLRTVDLGDAAGTSPTDQAASG